MPMRRSIGRKIPTQPSSRRAYRNLYETTITARGQIWTIIRRHKAVSKNKQFGGQASPKAAHSARPGVAHPSLDRKTAPGSHARPKQAPFDAHSRPVPQTFRSSVPYQTHDLDFWVRCKAYILHRHTAGYAVYSACSCQNRQSRYRDLEPRIHFLHEEPSHSNLPLSRVVGIFNGTRSGRMPA